MLLSAGIALAFMLAVLILGRAAVPLLNRALNIASDEAFLLVVFGALLLLSGLGETVHVAEAIGALLTGLVLAETEHRDRLEHLILPFRDFFGALFFFSFGLTIDPLALGGAVWPALGAVLLTSVSAFDVVGGLIVGNLLAGFAAGHSAGLSPLARLNIGVTIVSRGEFSIVMANLGQAGGLLAVLQPFAALYVLILAVLGPLLAREAKPVFAFLNRIFKWQKPKAAVPPPPAP